MCKKMFQRWVLKKIVNNTKLFGGDNGSSAIIKEYLVELYGGTKVEDLPFEAISQSVAASRLKNKLLKEYPMYDYRLLHKPKR